MSETDYVTNVTLLAKYLDWTVNDKLLNMIHVVDDEVRPVGFRQIDRHSGGNKIYSAHVWSTAVDWLDSRYRDDLFNILKGNADDCYLYEQTEDQIARIYYLDTWGWVHIK